MAIAGTNTLANGLIPAERFNPIARDLALILAGSVLLAISAQVKVPIGPVPINLTSMVVMLIGAVYGWRLGGATIVAYWMQGIAIGGAGSLLPWFANGSGLGYFLMAPSAGFLWGYLAMAVVVGYLADNLGMRRNALLLFIAMLAGQAALYAIGLAHAYFLVMPVVDWMSNAGQMFAIYLTPFVTGDLLKTALAALLVTQGWQLLGDRLR